MKDVHLADIGNQDLVTSLAVCPGKSLKTKKLLSELADNLVQLYAWLSEVHRATMKQCLSVQLINIAAK